MASELTRRALLGAIGVGALGLLAGCAAAGSTAGSGSSRLTGLSAKRAGVSGGTRVGLLGSGLGEVTSVTVDGVPATVRRGESPTFVVPAAKDFVAGHAEVVARSSDGTIGSATLEYALLSGVDRQLNYVLRYWKTYNPAYEVVADNDCVDFASQALLARGWGQTSPWTHDADDVYDSGDAWLSSTAMRDWLSGAPERATALTDDQRASVRLGDLVQFDWDASGDRDHTGTVTSIATVGGRTKIGFAGHTNDSDYRDVDDAITKDHPGGIAYYWSLR